MAALSAHWTTPILDMRRLFDEHPADAVVCVHSLLAHPAAFALRGRAPLICVVTDIAEPPAAWVAPGSTALVMSPTAEARARSILPDERVHFIGPVVNPHFVARPYLLTDPVNVLLVGGSEGMGKIEAVAYTLDRANLPLHLTVVAGHNERLRTRLAAHTWRKPTEILGYVNDMPQRMAAAHVLVSKAGPGTIAEACAVGLPMILFDAIPAQETGNVAYVIKHGAGAWGPSPNAVVNCLDEWLRRGALPQIAAAASALATSNAVHEAATFIYSQTETRQDMLSLRAT